MGRVRPFRALRYGHARPHRGSSLPALEPGLALDGGAELLGRGLASGVLTEEGPPALCVLELRPVGRVSRSPARYLLGAMGPERLVPLEEAAPPTPALMPAVVLAADDQQRVRSLLEDAASRQPATWEAQLESGTVRVWRLEGRMARHLADALEDAPLRPLTQVPGDRSFFAAVLPLSDPGLELSAIHRGLRGWATFRPDRFLTVVSGYARVYELEVPLTTERGRSLARDRLASLSAGHHAVLLVLPNGEGRILRFRQALALSQLKAVPKSPTLRSLDLALLHALVFKTVLGVDQPERPDHANVALVPRLSELVAQVEAGALQAGFALNPPPLWELRAVMEAQQSLPPCTLRLLTQPPPGLLFLQEEG